MKLIDGVYIYVLLRLAYVTLCMDLELFSCKIMVWL